MAQSVGNHVVVLLAISLLVLGSIGVASAASRPRVSIGSPTASSRLALPVGHASVVRVALAVTDRRLVRSTIAAAGRRPVTRPRSNEVLVPGSIAGGLPPVGSALAAGPRAPPWFA